MNKLWNKLWNKMNKLRKKILEYLQSDIVQIPANIFDVDIVVECNPASSIESFILGMAEK